MAVLRKMSLILIFVFSGCKNDQINLPDPLEAKQWYLRGFEGAHATINLPADLFYTGSGVTVGQTHYKNPQFEHKMIYFQSIGSKCQTKSTA